MRVTVRNWRRIGSCQQTSGLVSRKSRPWLASERATLTGRKAGTVEKDAGTIDHPRLAARQFTIGKMIRMFLLGPTADAGILVLPLAGLQLPDRLADAFLVGGVGKMGAEVQQPSSAGRRKYPGSPRHRCRPTVR